MARYQQFYRISSTSRRYRNPMTDEEISRRQYDNLRREAEANAEEVTMFDPHPSITQNYQQQVLENTGAELSVNQVESSGEFQAIVAGLNDNTGERVTLSGSKIYPPDSPKARALILLGRRRPEDNWWVGETPKQ